MAVLVSPFWMTLVTQTYKAMPQTLALIDVKPDTQVGLFNISRDTTIELSAPVLIAFVVGLIVGKIF
jgi:hypothetical protein